ncbi:uncharacterized protein LOC115921823 [Strongylocentrotus purpuratus]|uniref:Uncharacterized protein n=1 Tax=Strongylocentrotus purpuratus TaxID=7668 RepID=A0A7M7NHY7_STRPU|nr:uncharacterized protein LOC115921823 [Strongylocentrotus purpuratus]
MTKGKEVIMDYEGTLWQGIVLDSEYLEDSESSDEEFDIPLARLSDKYAEAKLGPLPVSSPSLPEDSTGCGSGLPEPISIASDQITQSDEEFDIPLARLSDKYAEAKLGPLPVSSPSLPEDSTGCGSGLPEPISIASDQITQSDEEFDIPLARLSDKYAEAKLGPLPVSSPSLPEDSTGCGSGLPEPISIASDQITQSDEEFDIPLARLSDKYAEAKLGPLPVSSPSLPEDSTGCGSGLPEPISIASDQITQSDEEFDIPLARLSDKYAEAKLGPLPVSSPSLPEDSTGCGSGLPEPISIASDQITQSDSHADSPLHPNMQCGQRNPETCDNFMCTDEVWAACPECLCFLCFLHFNLRDDCLCHNLAFNLSEIPLDISSSASQYQGLTNEEERNNEDEVMPLMEQEEETLKTKPHWIQELKRTEISRCEYLSEDLNPEIMYRMYNSSTEVVEVQSRDIDDWKSVGNRKVFCESEPLRVDKTVDWKKFMAMKVVKGEVDSVYFKYSHTDEELM